jgi:hypothetical protein
MSDRQSLLHRTLRTCDPDTIRQHIDRWTRLDLMTREFLGMPDGLQFTYGGTTATKIRRFIVKVNGKDLYEVDVGFYHRRRMEWVPLAWRSDVQAEALTGVVRELVKEVDG